MGDQQLHPGEQASRQPHYAAPMDRDRLYDGLPALTNRVFGRVDERDYLYSYGYPGQGGYGDDRGHQGGYGESQGRHAQSGHGRGAAFDRDERVSRGPRSGHRGRGPANYVRSDDSITDELIVRLTDADHIDASEILLIVEDGVVTLSGNVPERAMKHAAEDLAEDVRGVREVRNRIRVDDGSASAGRPGEAVRTGRDQFGSGFSSSARPDAVYDNPRDHANWPGT